MKSTTLLILSKLVLALLLLIYFCAHKILEFSFKHNFCIFNVFKFISKLKPAGELKKLMA